MSTAPIIQGEVFDAGPHYKNLDLIGEGAYSMVCSATDDRSGQKVAIKRIHAFELRRASTKINETYCLRTLREIKILRKFNHDNIINIQDIIRPPPIDDLQKIYIVQTLMETSLYKLLKTQKLSNEHICYFMYQIFRALKYIHSANVIHCDLRPSNILLNSDCDLKICDFGLARVLNGDDRLNSNVTEVVHSRWYRSPEFILDSKNVTTAVDIWGAGCILAEMFSNKPLFPGKHYLDQLHCFFKVLGTPSEESTHFIKDEKTREYFQSLTPQEKVSWTHLYPNADPKALDLLEKLLSFDPDKRVKVEDAISHSYFDEYHDLEDEPLAEEPFKFEQNLNNLSEESLKKMLFEATKIFDISGR